MPLNCGSCYYCIFTECLTSHRQIYWKFIMVRVPPSPHRSPYLHMANYVYNPMSDGITENKNSNYYFKSYSSAFGQLLLRWLRIWFICSPTSMLAQCQWQFQMVSVTAFPNHFDICVYKLAACSFQPRSQYLD